MKKNVRPIEDSLNKVLRMRGVSFIWNKDGLLPNYGKDIVFIALKGWRTIEQTYLLHQN